MSAEFEVGQTVTGLYKTGKYVGEITDIRPQHYLVRVLAVLKHPTQGDLHNPNQADVPLFHTRRALAFREQTNIPKPYVKAFAEEVPSYEESLKEALAIQIDELEKDSSEWGKKAIENLKELEKDYFK